jgi:hypothetical protein
VCSLDAHGHTRTLFSTSATPGAPKGTRWPFFVRARTPAWLTTRYRPTRAAEAFRDWRYADSSGTFALMTEPRRAPCGLRLGLYALSVGQIGQPGLQILTREALGEKPPTTAFALAGGQAAYAPDVVRARIKELKAEKAAAQASLPKLGLAPARQDPAAVLDQVPDLSERLRKRRRRDQTRSVRRLRLADHLLQGE